MDVYAEFVALVRALEAAPSAVSQRLRDACELSSLCLALAASGELG